MRLHEVFALISNNSFKLSKKVAGTMAKSNLISSLNELMREKC